MSFEDFKGPGTQGDLSSIEPSALADLKDIIGDFVEYSRFNHPGDFDHNNDYDKGLETNFLRDKSNINESLSTLLNDLESPDTADDILDLLKGLDKKQLKFFLADIKVKNYFKRFDKYDVVIKGDSDDNTDYQEKLKGIKGKYQKLLNGLDGEAADKDDKEDNSDAKESEEEIDSSYEGLYLQIEGLLSGKEKITTDMEGLDQWLSLLLKDESSKVRFTQGYRDYLSAKVKELESSLDNNKKDESNKKDKKEIKLDIAKINENIAKLNKDSSLLKQVLSDMEALVLGGNVADLLSLDLTAKEIVEKIDLQKTLNTAFHFDETQYKVLVASYDIPDQQKAVQESVLAYITLMNQGLKIEGLEDIQSSDILLGKDLNTTFSTKDFDENKFYITKEGQDVDGKPTKKIYGLEKDATTNKQKLVEVPNNDQYKLTAYFGDSKGNPWTLNALSQLELGSQEAKSLEWVMSNDPAASSLFKNSEEGMKIASGRETNKSTGKQSNIYANFGDALNAFFDTSMWDQIKIMFIALGAVGSEKEEDRDRAQLQIDYINMKSQWRKESFPDKKTGKNINYSFALSKYEPSSKEGNGDKSYKQLFVNASPDVQKNYIETAYTSGKEAGYAVLRKDSPKIEIPGKETDNGIDVEPIVPSETVVFESGMKIESLKSASDPVSLGEVNLVSDGGKPSHLLVDEKVVSLSKGLDGADSPLSGSLFVKTKSGEVQEKTVKISTGADGNQTITIESETPLTVAELNGDTKKTVFTEDGVIKYPQEIGFTTPQLPVLNYFAWSPLNSPVKEFYSGMALIEAKGTKTTIQKAFADAQRSIHALTTEPNYTNLEKNIKEAVTEAKKSMFAAGNINDDLIKAINSWGLMFGVEKTKDTEKTGKPS